MNKYKYIVISILAALCQASCSPNVEGSFEKESNYSGSLSLSGAFALYPLTILWSEDFKEIYPNVRFNISAGGAGKGIADVLTDMVDIGLVSRDLHPQEIAKGAYPIVVAKDAVIPTINSQHPNIELILKRGLSQIELQNIFIHAKYKTWKDIDTRFVDSPIQVYVRSDAAGAAETWAKFFKANQEDLKGVGIFGDPGLAQVVKDDPLAIGFNNLNYVFDLNSKRAAAGIRALPIDLNANGVLDKNEDFYQNLDSLTNSIAKNQYPSPPARDLFFVLRKNASSKLIKTFLTFILQKEAQKQLLANGYVPLDEEHIRESLKRIQNEDNASIQR